MIQKFGGRKFLFAVASMLVSAVLVYFELLDADNFTKIVMTGLSLFTAGNVAQKVLTGKASQSPSSS